MRADAWAEKVAWVTAEMEAFDDLPAPVRAAIRNARSWMSPRHYAQVCANTPPEIVVKIIRDADARQAAAERRRVAP